MATVKSCLSNPSAAACTGQINSSPKAHLTLIWQFSELFSFFVKDKLKVLKFRIPFCYFDELLKRNNIVLSSRWHKRRNEKLEN